MPSPFVPFLKPRAATAATPAVVATDSAAASAAFTALSAGAAPAACAHAPTPGEQPVVTLEKDGDRVTHVRIQCTCGQVIELDCAY
jgi:hypothetical protein